MRTCEKATGLSSMTAATLALEVRIRITPVVLEPMLERDVVDRNLTRDVARRLCVELVHRLRSRKPFGDMACSPECRRAELLANAPRMSASCQRPESNRGG
jgi:hypothetical protein